MNKTKERDNLYLLKKIYILKIYTIIGFTWNLMNAQSKSPPISTSSSGSSTFLGGSAFGAGAY